MTRSLFLLDLEGTASGTSISTESSPRSNISTTPRKPSGESFLVNHGFVKTQILSKTLQGELFTAERIGFDSNDPQRYVAIKKTPKRQYRRREAIDGDGFNFIVDEDIVKEAAILRHLTVQNQPIGGTIAQYIDFFESATDFYLVMEHISSNMDLKQFVLDCHRLIQMNKLKLSDYQRIIKYVLWQLVATVHWLHWDMSCCHLDICCENIMLNDVMFISNTDGTISIDPKISVKLVDFGVSEISNASERKHSLYFNCNKQHISLDNEQYLCPNIYKQDYYDGYAADMWSLGMVIYFCFIGDYPYKTIQETDFNEPISGTPYHCIYHHQLRAYLQTNDLLKWMHPKAVSMLNGLLNIDEVRRLKSLDVLQHEWFQSYYKRYSSQIERKSRVQKRKLLRQIRS